MLKNRFFLAFAFVGLVGITACGGESEVNEEPVIEEPIVEPITEPAPATTDTSMIHMDTAAEDTATDVESPM